MKTLSKITITTIILSFCCSVFASNYRVLTEQQYIKWKETVHTFVYANSMKCANLKYAKLIWNDAAANNIRSENNRMRDMQCSSFVAATPVKVKKTFYKNRIALATIDLSETWCDENNKCTSTYALADTYIFPFQIHNAKELKNKFIK